MQLYRTSLPVRDLENFRPMDFCWTECTCKEFSNYKSPGSQSRQKSQYTGKLRLQAYTTPYTYSTDMAHALLADPPIMFSAHETEIVVNYAVRQTYDSRINP